MNNKHQVHNLIILDESGSMQSIKGSVISGFNEIVQTIKGIQDKMKDQEHFVTLLTFNTLGNKMLHFAESVDKLAEIDHTRYRPNAGTPLFDAMGTAFQALEKHLEDAQDYNVLVTIFTDGEENASKEYSGQHIKDWVEALKQKRWTFTYIGTDHDVSSVASSISINNVMIFKRDKADMEQMFLRESKARERYSAKILYQEGSDEDYYKDGIEEEKKGEC